MTKLLQWIFSIHRAAVASHKKIRHKIVPNIVSCHLLVIWIRWLIESKGNHTQSPCTEYQHRHQGLDRTGLAIRIKLQTCIVWVLPDPVCPNANRQTLCPSMREMTSDLTSSKTCRTFRGRNSVFNCSIAINGITKFLNWIFGRNLEGSFQRTVLS